MNKVAGHSLKVKLTLEKYFQFQYLHSKNLKIELNHIAIAKHSQIFKDCLRATILIPCAKAWENVNEAVICSPLHLYSSNPFTVVRV